MDFSQGSEMFAFDFLSKVAGIEPKKAYKTSIVKGAKGLTLLFLATFLLSSCSEDKGDSKDPGRKNQIWSLSDDNAELNSNYKIQVKDLDGNPIAGAKILLGQALNAPINGNLVVTDKNGVATAPSKWIGALTATISAKGYLRASYLNQTPVGQTFYLRPSSGTQNLELTGQGTGFKVVDSDKKIDFALMIPALDKQDLFAFDVNKFVSPESDVITVIGQEVKLPSNLSVPKQRETYIIPITLEKPKYRMYFSKPSNYWVYTLKGQFPFRDLIKHVQDKKPMYQAINFFSFQGGSIKNVSITNPSTIFDLPVDELKFTDKKTFNAPKVAAEEVLLATAISPYLGKYFPTDVKNVEAEKPGSLVVAVGEMQILAMIKSKASELSAKASKGRLSVALSDFTNGVSPELLDLLDDPRADAKSIAVRSLSNNVGLKTMGSHALLSRIEGKSIGGKTIKMTKRIWEVYANNWATNILLPELPENFDEDSIAKTIPNKWEISFVGNSKQESVELGPKMLNAASHASRVSVDF